MAHSTAFSILLELNGLFFDLYRQATCVHGERRGSVFVPSCDQESSFFFFFVPFTTDEAFLTALQASRQGAIHWRMQYKRMCHGKYTSVSFSTRVSWVNFHLTPCVQRLTSNKQEALSCELTGATKGRHTQRTHADTHTHIHTHNMDTLVSVYVTGCKMKISLVNLTE